MKHYLFPLWIFIVLCSGCKHQNRTLDDIYSDICTAIGDSTVTADSVAPLFLEYGDAIYNAIVTSEIGDIGPRLNNMVRATDAILIALDYLPEGAFESLSGSKLFECNSVWGIEKSGDDGCTFYKEIPFVAYKDTDHEEHSYMAIAVEDIHGSSGEALVQVPSVAEYLIVTFANLGEDGTMDFENSSSMEPDSYEEGKNMDSFYFKAVPFIEEMKSHDYLFILYIDKDNFHESAMTRLDKFHEQIN